MAEGDAGEQEAPEQRNGDAEEGRQHTVTPVLRHSEGGVAEFPHAVQTVRTIGLRNDVLKIHLNGGDAFNPSQIKRCILLFQKPPQDLCGD